MTLALRDYQKDLINRTRTKLRTHKSVLMVAPTGAGKTVLMASMLAGAAAKGNRSVFLVPREELLEQSVATLGLADIEPGVIAAGHKPNYDKPIQVAMVGSLKRRMGDIIPPRLVVPDECHHCVSKTYTDILATWASAKVVGLTATPERLDGKGLGEHFEVMVEGPSVTWLMESGYLSPYKAYAPTTVPTAGVRVTAGDYNRSDLEGMMDKPAIIGGIVDSYLKRAEGKRAIVFAVGVKASRALAEAFVAAGVSAAHVDGDTDKTSRHEAMERFKAGGVRVLCNVDLFGEGVDVPGMEAVILARPTASMGLHRQQVGRVLRYQPGKVALILDHAGNLLRHGLPDDDVAWSLDGRPRRSRAAMEETMSVRTCPACYAVSPMGAKACEMCGAAYPLTPREVKEIEGQLAEVERQARRREQRMEQGQARSFEELVALGKKRGYKNPYGWAKFIRSSRGAV